jgi:hypothetical protein
VANDTIRVKLPAPSIWTIAVPAVMAVALVPWAIALNTILPGREVVRNWDVAWTGFDLALAAGLAAIAVTAYRRSPWTSHFAVVAATLLACDAWFDVVTARDGTEVILSVAGLAVELPLAALCLVIARRAVRSSGA